MEFLRVVEGLGKVVHFDVCPNLYWEIIFKVVCNGLEKLWLVSYFLFEASDGGDNINRHT